jgi:4-methyl-5(b-hydroxyethyl)-thiazole monophosphate biosynthesis
MKRALVPLAEGFEELEAVTIIDILRRAGIEVIVAALTDNPVTGSHGIKLSADATLDAVSGQEFDLIALPGGMPGAANLMDDSRIGGIIRRLLDGGGHVAAICAAPMVLAAAGVLEGRRATCFPGFLDRSADLTLVDEPVVVDGRIITSRGPGTALDFALELVAQLSGPGTQQKIESQLQRGGAGR